MASWLDTQGFDTDAPPYAIVCACRLLGLDRPEDVGWYRLDHRRYVTLRERPVDRRPAFPPTNSRSPAITGTCVCGARLPPIEHRTFTFNTGRQVGYSVGQCRRCRTIFWAAP
jgi:hypothetical protein